MRQGTNIVYTHFQVDNKFLEKIVDTVDPNIHTCFLSTLFLNFDLCVKKSKGQQNAWCTSMPSINR